MAAPARQEKKKTYQILCCSHRVIKRSDRCEVAALGISAATYAHHVMFLLTAIVLLSGTIRYVTNTKM
jgi:hypothetical protein